MYIRVNTMRPMDRRPYFFAFVVSPFARISHLHPHSLVARYMTRVMCIRARLVEEVIEYLVHTLGARVPLKLLSVEPVRIPSSTNLEA